MSLKRWIALIIFAALFLFYIIGQVMVTEPLAINQGWSEEVYQSGGIHQIALLDVQGMIMDQPADVFMSPQYSHDIFLKQLERAFTNPQIDGIVLRIDSPGGSPVASDEVHHTIQQLKAEHDKPLVVYMGSQATSGAYYISMPADYIYANSSTITGSIGVIMSSINFEELLDNWGIEDQTFTSGPHKDILSMMREMTAEDREIVQSIVDDLYEPFVNVVSEGRDMDRDRVLELADGRVFSGNQALEAELIDGLGVLDDAIEEAADRAGIANPTVIHYKRSGWSGMGLLASQWLGVESSNWLSIVDLVYGSHPSFMYLPAWPGSEVK